jgi:hypothetical protein
MNDDIEDCDIFEIAEVLYSTLKLAERALNQCRNTPISADNFKDSYAVAAEIGTVLQTYKDRI